MVTTVTTHALNEQHACLHGLLNKMIVKLTKKKKKFILMKFPKYE